MTKLRVAGIHRGGLRVAAVQLDVVHPPLREGVGVSLEVAQYAGVPPTCQLPVVLVDAKFEAELVDVVSQCRDPTGESFWVGLKFSLWRSDTTKNFRSLQTLTPSYSPLGIQPAVVNDDGVVAGIFVPAQHHHVRHLLKEVLADAELRVLVTVSVAPEPLPGQPAHGWGHSQAIVQPRHQHRPQQHQHRKHGVTGRNSGADCDNTETSQTCYHR